MFVRIAAAVLSGLLLTLPAAVLAAEEKQSVFYDELNGELTSSQLIKLLNKKLDGVYQDLELVVTSCFSGELAQRAKTLLGDWSVATSTDIKHANTTIAGEIKGAGNFKIGGDTFNGWMPAWLSKLTTDGNTIGNKALADYASAEKLKAVKGSTPQYSSSGKTADDMTLHGGAMSNHAVVFQTTGFTAVLDGVISALKAAGYTDAEINRQIPTGAAATWDNFSAALDDLRKKLDKNPKKEKALIILQTHGATESRTVAYAPGGIGGVGGGALVSAAAASFAMSVSDSTVLAQLGQDLLKPGGGIFSHAPELARKGPATLRFSSFDSHFDAPADVGITVNGHLIGTLALGQSAGADYQISIPDAILSEVFGDVLSSHSLDLGFNFASSNDWLRIATPEDWSSATATALDYGVGISANCCIDTSTVPEPSTLVLFGAAWIISRQRRSWAGSI